MKWNMRFQKTENNIVMSKKDKDKKIAKCENFYHEIIFLRNYFSKTKKKEMKHTIVWTKKN